MATKQDNFIGVRVTEEIKAKLTTDAQREGVSLSDHVKRILGAGKVPKNGKPPEWVQADTWQKIAKELESLENEKERLVELVEERSGWFTKAPYSLRLSLQACNRATTNLQEKLEEMLPPEDIEKLKDNNDKDEW